MARARARARSAGLSLEIEWDGVDETVGALRHTRTRIRRELQAMQQTAADRQVLPGARRGAGRLDVEGQSVGASLRIVKMGAGFVGLTTSMRGVRGRAVGLLEYGGTVRTPIRPRHAKALTVGDGVVSIVRTARHYRARKFLTEAAQDHLDEFGQDVRDQLVGVFADAGIPVD